MPRNPNQPLQQNWEQLARRHTARLIDQAVRHFAVVTPAVRIGFDLRGMSAGQFRSRNGRDFEIRYNPALLARHGQDFLDRTVPHETAHLIALRLYGPRIQPHGREWQSIMRIFGAIPDRCHSYDTAGLETRHLHRHPYRCACRTHQLTSIRHNRAQRGLSYCCRQCGETLQWVPGSTDLKVED